MGTATLCMALEVSMSRQGVSVWKCPDGHALGVVRRNGRKVRQLYLYRTAIDAGSDELDDVEVLAVVDGPAEVCCSKCGKVRTWVPGQEELDRLIAMVKRGRSG